jgi:transposase
VINGILWRLRTGAPWRDVPDRYGPWQTLHKRLRRWQLDGTWARIEAVLQNDTDVAEESNRYVDVPFVEMDADRESVRSGPDGPPLR